MQQIQFDFNLFIVPAIRAQLPETWQYNLENYKSQDMLDRKIGICPKIRQFYRPIWGTERYEKILLTAAGCVLTMLLRHLVWQWACRAEEGLSRT